MDPILTGNIESFNSQFYLNLIECLRQNRETIREISEQTRRYYQRIYEKQDEHCAIVRIFNYISFLNKYNCISSAKYVCRFLTHPSSNVRGVAASALEFIVRYIASCIFSCDNEKLLEEYFIGLEGLRDILKDNNYSKDIAKEMEFIKDLIDSLILLKNKPDRELLCNMSLRNSIDFVQDFYKYLEPTNNERGNDKNKNLDSFISQNKI